MYRRVTELLNWLTMLPFIISGNILIRLFTKEDVLMYKTYSRKIITNKKVPIDFGTFLFSVDLLLTCYFFQHHFFIKLYRFSVFEKLFVSFFGYVTISLQQVVTFAYQNNFPD
jgi:hypothetical protein